MKKVAATESSKAKLVADQLERFANQIRRDQLEVIRCVFNLRGSLPPNFRSEQKMDLIDLELECKYREATK